MITQKQIRNIIMEEVAFVEERFMSSKFRKAIEKYQDLQLKQQQLQKAFVGTKDVKQREKLKKALIKLHYIVKKAEAEFNSALHVEPVELEEAEVEDDTEFTVNIKHLLKKHVTKGGEVTEALARGLKPLLKLGSTITKKVGEDTLVKLSDKFDRIDDEYAGEIASHLDMAIELMQDGYPGDATKKLKQFNKACKDVLKGKTIKSAFAEGVNESTKAYGDTLKKIARDKQLKMISPKDKETLLKIAALMKKMKEGTLSVTEEQSGILKEKAQGLWANIKAKQDRGEKPASKGSKAYNDAVAAGKEINNENEIIEADITPKTKSEDKLFPRKSSEKKANKDVKEGVTPCGCGCSKKKDGKK